jgi:valyl-tRNA synthetase
MNAPGNSLAAPAVEVVREGRIKLIPEGWKNNYFGWMEQIQDWCISRQIWWGHRIPVWYCTKPDCDPKVIPVPKSAIGAIGEGAALPEPTEEAEPPYVIDFGARPIRPPSDAPQIDPTTCPECGGTNLIQDFDVLDTWFSSALWPFSTLGWPKDAPELNRFYPTSTLVTSFDILFFWVARMIMMGLHFTKQVPFKDVYIHALVRDAEGQKMSKSKGNVIDPLSIMDQYGTDALRFTLAAMASPGRDVKLSEQRIEGYRNFANKLWNASRFVLMNTEGHTIQDDPTKRSLADRWITVQLQECVKAVWTALENYRFDEAANRLYQFIWHEYCDWYIELVKPRLATDADPDMAAATRATMVKSLETMLRLLHPFMPFITEEIWQKLPHAGETIVLASYPEVFYSDDDQSLDTVDAVMYMRTVIAIVTWIRTFRSELNISPAQQLKAGFRTPAFYAGTEDIKRLARLSEFHVGPHVLAPPDAVVESLSEGEVFVVPDGVDILKETTRLEKVLTADQAERDRIWTKLKNPGFTAKAPPDVVSEHDSRVRELNKQIDHRSKRLNQLRKMSGQSSG